MADQVLTVDPLKVQPTPSVITVDPSLVQTTLAVDPSKVTAVPKPAERESLAHKIWSRAMSPIKAEEFESIPGQRPGDWYNLQTKGWNTPFSRTLGTMEESVSTLNRAGEKTLSDWFLSPVQKAMRYLGPLQAAAGGAFVGDQAHDLYENWDRMGTAERSAALAGIVGGAIMTGHGVYTTAHPPARPAATKPLTIQDHLAYKYNVVPSEASPGNYEFKDPTTGGSIAVPREGFSEQRMRAAVEAHRERFKSEPAPTEPYRVEHVARQQALNEEFRRTYTERLPEKVGFFRYWFSQPTRAMRESGVPEVEKVGELISHAEVSKSMWFHSALDQVTHALKGQSSRGIRHVAEILDTERIPHNALGHFSTRDGQPFTPQEIQSAVALRVQLLNIWNQMHVASGRQPGEFRLGFIQDYLPHMEKFGLGERLMTALRNEWHAPEDAPSRFTPEEPTTEKRGRGLTQFIMRRRRAIDPNRIEYDLRKLLPSYLRGVSRVLFDRSAILEAEDSLKGLPENSTWRQYADAYLDKYTYKMHQGYYDRLTRSIGRRLMNTATRSVLGFSLRLQELHLARLVTSVWPEMQTKDFAYGLAKVARNPKAAYERAARIGILPQTVPLKYMSGFWQRFDTIANYLGAADFIDRSVAFEGQYHKYLREGLPPDQAVQKAAIDAKDFSFLSSPAHTPLAFGHGAGMGLGDAVTSMALQYKNIPTSLLYQYTRAVMNIKSDPMKTAKFVAAITTALITQYETGAHLVHFASNILNIRSVVAGVAQRISDQLTTAWKHRNNEMKFKQHIKEAIEATMELIPGGLQVERVRRYGIKSLVREPTAEERKQKDREWKRKQAMYGH